MKNTVFNAVDLFSGAGGISLGLKRANFNIVLANDIDRDFSTAHRFNHPDIPFLEKDITKFDSNVFKTFCNGHKIHLVTGGPPCQGFSMTGMRKSTDPRNQLFKHYIKILKKLSPDFFFMENVTGILTLNTKKENNNLKFIDYILQKFRNISNGKYHVGYKIINMADYGVPQLRKRVIIVGNKLNYTLDECFPKPTHTQSTYTTVWDSIKDIMELDEYDIPNHRCMNHSKNIVQRMKLVKPGQYISKKRKTDTKQTFQCVYQRLRKNFPAPTLVPGHSAFPIHPVKHRSLTFREAAILQTFPNDFKFFGTQIKQGLAVGNAVPPLFATKLCRHIHELLEKSL